MELQKSIKMMMLQFLKSIDMIMRFIKKNFYLILLILISLLLFWANFQPGTYLTGWDNLQTELNPVLAVKRSLFAIWEEYQSFGLLSGLAHSTDIVRAVFLWLLSYILPQNIIRYFFHTFMLLAGGLGAFKLLDYVFSNHLGPNNRKAFAFMGALFYMLNFGTVQIFYVPYEAFSVFFASLPWQIWIFMKSLENKNKRNLFLFSLINFLATPAYYIQTLFIVYLLILLLLIVERILENQSLKFIKSAAFFLLLVILINAFWLFPQLYFLRTSVSVVKNAKINQLATDDLFFQNKEKGTLSYFLKMQGFYFDLFRTNQQSLFLEWKNHFANAYINFLLYFFAFVSLLGLFSKRKFHLFFVGVFILVTIALLNTTAPFSWINDWLRQNYFINQVFRSPFTKFIIPYSLVASYLLVSGINNLISWLSRFISHDRTNLINYLLGLLIFAIFLYSLPSFQGYFFSPSIKVAIPTDYLQLMDYFIKTDKNKRIALLPDYTYWGWFYTRWGYDGSGFLWYGLEQPIVSRTFDVWSNKSESYFWEAKTEAEAEDLNNLEKVFEKYDIDYLLLDRSLLPVSSTVKGLQYDRLETMFASSKKIVLVRKSENLSLYQIKHDKKIQNFVAIASALPNIGPGITLTSRDAAYIDNNDYQTSVASSYFKYYPFLDLTSQTQIVNKRWTIQEDPNNFFISTKLSIEPQKYKLILPPYQTEAVLYQNNQVLKYSESLIPKVNGNNLTITIPKKLISSVALNTAKVNNCSLKGGEIETKYINSSLISTSLNAGLACLGFDGSFLDQRYGYLVKINNKNSVGRRFFFYILDDTKKQSYIEDRLQKDAQYYLLNPRYQYGLGYSFSFHNDSYRNIPSINRLDSVQVYSFPTSTIQNIYFVNNNITANKNHFLNNFKSKKNTYFDYTASFGQSDSSSLILNQAYHSGWVAYKVGNENALTDYFPFLFGTQLKDHVLVNNWANGWRIDSSDKGTVIIIFLPQYLEFLGFVVLILTFIFIARARKVN